MGGLLSPPSAPACCQPVGRYKVFPVVGTGLMTIGLYLMSLIG